MAVVPMYTNTFSKDQVPLASKLIRQNGKNITGDCLTIQRVCKSSSSISGDRIWHELYHKTFRNKGKIREGSNAFRSVFKRMPIPFQTINKVSALCTTHDVEGQVSSSSKDVLQSDKRWPVSYASESSTKGSQLKALDSYFNKLQNDKSRNQTALMPSKDSKDVANSETNMEPSLFPGKATELLDRSGQLKAKKGLSSIDNYLGKLRADSEKNLSTTSEEETTEKTPTRTPFSVNRDYEKREEKKLNNYMKIRIKDAENGSENSQGLEPYDEASDIYLVCILASINIAVFLFEIASPVRNSDVELLSLPSLYGAKINQLILSGEWWRLVTPMFLHSGILHVALGCWVLLTFGPQVCKGYGSCTFFLIYILGGISGNLTSFFHTTEPTVGGTGPAFAMIGAWLIYQLLNKDAISKDISESMFQKAVIATTLSFVVSNFGPIDDWTHLGAVCAGIAYGFLTCPTLQLDNSSSKTSQEDGITLVRRYANPCKSIITFAIFIILIFSSLIFFLEPQVITLELNSFM